MKRLLAISAVVVFMAVSGFAQTDRPSGAPADNNIDHNDYTPRQPNYGWIGLIGLAGLAGLRRAKSEDVRRLEATGVNVNTVRS